MHGNRRTVFWYVLLPTVGDAAFRGRRPKYHGVLSPARVLCQRFPLDDQRHPPPYLDNPRHIVGPPDYVGVTQISVRRYSRRHKRYMRASMAKEGVCVGHRTRVLDFNGRIENGFTPIRDASRGRPNAKNSGGLNNTFDTVIKSGRQKYKNQFLSNNRGSTSTSFQRETLLSIDCCERLALAPESHV